MARGNRKGSIRSVVAVSIFKIGKFSQMHKILCVYNTLVAKGYITHDVSHLQHLSPYIQMLGMRYPVTCKVYAGYHAMNKLKHGSSARTVDKPLLG